MGGGQNPRIVTATNCDKKYPTGDGMNISVRYKLFLVILMAACLSVVSSTLITKWSLDRGFLKFVNMMEQDGLARLTVTLEETYRSEQNWDFLRHDPLRWEVLLSQSMPELAPPRGGIPPSVGKLPPHPPEPSGKRLPPLPHHFGQRLFLLDADKKPVINTTPVPAHNPMTPLVCQGRVVGYLGGLPLTDISEMPHKRFLKEQKQGLILQAVVIVALAAVLSLLLARRLVRPLHELAQATHQLAAGRYTVRVPVESRDELGQLAGDFNALALSLEQSEQARHQWVADISHELRTPIAILRGEIEALQDGIRQPDTVTIKSLHNEVLRLGRLVDDLYQLSLSDAGALTYKKTDLDLAELLKETITVYRPQFLAKRIEIQTGISEHGSRIVAGDRERLQQLFSNLLDNSLKYTDGGGRVLITVQSLENRAVIEIEDSAPGVAPTDMERLFERLYRVESSRNRLTGGAGLGLTICRNIVEAHGGNITAQSSLLGGLLLRIELPTTRGGLWKN